MNFNEYNKKNSLNKNQIKDLDERLDLSWSKYAVKPTDNLHFFKRFTLALSAFLIIVLIALIVRPNIKVDVSNTSQIEASNIELRGYITDKKYTKESGLLFKDCLNNVYSIEKNRLSEYLLDSKVIESNETKLVFKGTLLNRDKDYPLLSIKSFEVRDEDNFCEVGK